MTELPKTLRPYTAFGVQFNDLNAHAYEVTATCPFCKRKDYLFVNKSTGVFECKNPACNSKGSISHFLTKIYEKYKATTTPEMLEKLSVHRKIPIKSLQTWGVIHNGTTYLLPVRDFKSRIVTLKRYKLGGKTIGMDGGSNSPYGLEQLYDPARANEPVYLCEGEFDCIALDYLLRRLGLPGICIGIPGADSFKKEYGPYFDKRNIWVCGDHDEAGRKFCEIVEQRLTGRASSIQYLNWPQNYRPKYDINDFIKDYVIKTGKPKDGFAKLMTYFKTYHKNTPKEKQATEDIKAEIFKGPPPALDEIIKKFKEKVNINDDFELGIRLAFATVLSAKIPGTDPVWLFLVGPPGCGKTLIINSIADIDWCVFQSTLSKASLLSGFATKTGYDPSLLARLNNKCLVLKDYTEVLALPESERQLVSGVMRGAYDGTLERNFGNGVVRKYPVVFASISGVTNKIYGYGTAALGERYLKYKLISGKVDYLAQATAAQEQALTTSDYSKELKFLCKHFLTTRGDAVKPDALESMVPTWFRQRTSELGTLTAHLRTPVERFERGVLSFEPMFKPQIEPGNRLSVQLQRLAIGLAVLEEKAQVDLGCYYQIRRVAFDTVDSYMMNIVQVLAGSKQALTIKELSEKLKLSQQALKHYIQDLEMLDIVQNAKPLTAKTGQKTKTYMLTNYIHELWKKVVG